MSSEKSPFVSLDQLFSLKETRKQAAFAQNRSIVEPTNEVTSTVGYHLYVDIALNLALSAAEKDEAAQKFLDILQEYAAIASRTVDVTGARLLEVQGERLHFLVESSGQNDFAAAKRLLTLAYSVVNVAYDRLEPMAGTHWAGCKAAAYFGPALVLLSDVGGGSVVSLGRAANEPAKRLSLVGGVTAGHLAIPAGFLTHYFGTDAGMSWQEINLRTPSELLLRFVEADKRALLADKAFYGAVIKAKLATANADFFGSLNTNSRLSPVKVQGFCLKADLDGFSKQVEEAYALKDGRLTHVSEVPSGQKCGCICINCNEPLVARKGQTRTAHFAHRVSSNCSPESALHKIAKQLLKSRIDTAIATQESLPFSWGCTYCKEAHQANLVRRAIKCEEEHVIDSARADIALLDEAGKAYAALEVVVTHKPDKQALETYERENVTLLRFDLKSERDLVKITDLESLRPDFAGHCLMPRCKHCRMFLKNRQLDVVEGGCWRCGQSMLIAFGNDGLTMMSPEEFDEIEIAAVRAKGVVLEVRYSKTVDSKYLANVCPHCRAISGSFYLHDYWYLSTEETKLNVSMGCPRCEKVYPKS